MPRESRPVPTPLLIVFSLLCASSALSQAAPTFYGVGDIAGGIYESEAFAISADGSTVVGSSQGGNGREAWYWTNAGGGTLVPMGVLYALDPDSEATGVSSDGSVIAGTSRDENGNRAFRWTSGGGMVELGTYGCTD